MPDGSRHPALVLLDLTLGTAAAGVDGLTRGAGLAARLAAPPARAVAGAGRDVARRIPAGPADRLRATGQQLQRTGRQLRDNARGRAQALVTLLANAVLDQLDLTDLVVQRVDLDQVAQHLDIDAIVARIDLIGLAEYIVDGIDLPKIIRDSTGSVASEGVRGVRMQGIEADEALAKFIDRLLLRRRPRRTGVEHSPADLKPPRTDLEPSRTGGEYSHTNLEHRHADLQHSRPGLEPPRTALQHSRPDMEPRGADLDLERSPAGRVLENGAGP
jgi:hypothetical protein